MDGKFQGTKKSLRYVFAPRGDEENRRLHAPPQRPGWHVSRSDAHPVVGGATVFINFAGRREDESQKKQVFWLRGHPTRPALPCVLAQRLWGALVSRYSGANRPGFTPDSLFSHSLWLWALFCEQYHYMWYTGQRTAQYVGDIRPKGQGTFQLICILQSARYGGPLGLRRR